MTLTEQEQILQNQPQGLHVQSLVNEYMQYGTDEVNIEKTRRALLHNRDAYKKIHSWGSKFNQAFDEAVGFLIDGLLNGTITGVDSSGNYHYSGEANAFTDGSDKNKTKALQAAAKYASEVINEGIAKSKLTRPPKKEYNPDLDIDIREALNAGKDWDEESINAFINLDAENADGTRVTANRAAQLSKVLLAKLLRLLNNEYEMGDYDSAVESAKLQAAIDALKDGVISENELSILSQAGYSAGDAKIALGTGNVTTTLSWEKEERERLKTEGWTDEEIEEYILALKIERADSHRLTIDASRLKHENYLGELENIKHDALWKSYRDSHYGNRYSQSWNLGKASLSRELYEKYLAAGWNPLNYYKLWLSNPTGTTNGKSNIAYLSNFLIYMYNNNSYRNSIYSNPLEDGRLIIRDSIDYDKGRALVFDPVNRTLSEIDSTHPEMRKILKNKWIEQNPYPYNNDTSVDNWKDGGVIKFNNGGNTATAQQLAAAILSGDMTLEDALVYMSLPSSRRLTTPTVLDTGTPQTINLMEDAKRAIATRQTAALKKRADEHGRTVKEQKYAEADRFGEGSTEFSTSDYIHLVNLVNDLSSIGTSYVPVYGTAIAGVLGLASMGLDLWADAIDDHVSRDQMWDNLKTNAGFAAVGMIPGGPGKIGKIWNSAKKLLPMLLSTYGLYEQISDPEVRKSFDKLIHSGKANELNNLDWTNILTTLKTFAFTHNTSKAASLAFNGTLKNSNYTPSIVRKFGEASIGSKRARVANLKSIQLGSLLNTYDSGFKGQKIKINTSEGVKEITLSESAAKLLLVAGNRARALENATADTVKTALSLEINRLLSDEASWANKAEFNALKDKRPIVTPALAAEYDAGTLDFAGMDKSNISSKLESLINGATDDAKIEIKLSSGKVAKLSKAELQELKNAYDTKVATSTPADDAAAQLALLEAFNPIYNRDGIRVLTRDARPEGPGEFSLAISDSDINLPKSSKLPKWLRRNKDVIALEDINTEPGLWDKYGPQSTSLFAGASQEAAANRLRMLKAREYENSLNSPLGKIFHNNWEMALGTGPLRFGKDSSYLDAKRHDFLNSDLYALEKRATDIAWARRSRVKEIEAWEKTPEGLAYISAHPGKSVENLYKAYKHEAFMNSELGKAITTTNEQGETVLRHSVNHELGKIISEFKRMSNKDIYAYIEEYIQYKDFMGESVSSLSGRDFIAAFMADAKKSSKTGITLLKFKDHITKRRLTRENNIANLQLLTTEIANFIDFEGKLAPVKDPTTGDINFTEWLAEKNITLGTTAEARLKLYLSYIAERNGWNVDDKLHLLKIYDEIKIRKTNAEPAMQKAANESALKAAHAEIGKRYSYDDIKNNPSEFFGDPHELVDIHKLLDTLNAADAEALIREYVGKGTNESLTNLDILKALLKDKVNGFTGDLSTRIAKRSALKSSENLIQYLGDIEGKSLNSEAALKQYIEEPTFDRAKLDTAIARATDLKTAIEEIKANPELLKELSSSGSIDDIITRFRSTINFKLVIENAKLAIANRASLGNLGRVEEIAKSWEFITSLAVKPKQKAAIQHLQDMGLAVDQGTEASFAFLDLNSSLLKSLGTAKTLADILKVSPDLAEALKVMRNGGILQYFKNLRGNFLEDNLTTELSKMEKGGILKMEKGGDTYIVEPSDWEWYKRLYALLELKNKNLRLHNNYAKDDLYEHNQNFDLGMAAKKNDAYTSLAYGDLVGLDLQNYYNTKYGNLSLEDFVTNYNRDALTIRNTWKNKIDHAANTETGLRSHNRLFREMFKNRSLAGIKSPYNIGYQENLDDTMGTSTWMRRMDRYRNEWKDTDKEDKLRRVHSIKLGDGSTGYVYKQANGDIDILSKEDYLALFPLETSPETPQNPTLDTIITPAGYNPPREIANKIYKAGLKAIDEINPADAIALGRLFKNLVNDRNIYNVLRNSIHPVMEAPMHGHLLTIRDINKEAAVQRSVAENLARIEGSKSSNAEHNVGSMLATEALGDTAMYLARMDADNDVKALVREADALQKKLYEYNIGVLNRNNTAEANYAKVLGDLDAAYRSAVMLNWNTYLMELELRARQKQADKLGFMDLLSLHAMHNVLNNDFEYNELYKKYTLEKDPEKRQLLYELALARLKELQELAYNEYMLLYALNHGISTNEVHLYLTDQALKNLAFLFNYKKGGVFSDSDVVKARIKARSEDNKQFNKTVQNGIKNHLKSLDNLSRSTLLALKKALNQ